MRITPRALARYLQPHTATGLTGVRTHATPRSTLLYLYGTTLDRLQSLPKTSLYRQSVEALTKHRMSIVEQMVPPGYEAWAEKARELIQKQRSPSFKVADGEGEARTARLVQRGDRVFIINNKSTQADDIYAKDESDEREDVDLDALSANIDVFEQRGQTEEKPVDWEDEPQMTAEQVEELENRIGAGLVEEIIQVAEGELQLIDKMKEAKIWEDLVEKPAPGQWTYFERKST